MDKKKINTASSSYNAGKSKGIPPTTKGKAPTKQGSFGTSNATATTKIISRGNLSSTSSYVLFWLDANIDPNDADCNHTIQQLQSVISTMHVFNDSSECANCLHTIQSQSAFMVVSGSLGQQILPRIHHMPQLTAVFIFCADKAKYEPLKTEWPKVRGVFTDIDSICQSLKRVFRQWDEESGGISVVSSSDISGQHFDQLDQSFMYTQLIKEILFEIKYNDADSKELIAYCRQRYAADPTQMEIIQSFEDEYKKYPPIWWYTKECFLYHMLNGALRNQETDVIVKMGFFLCDLHQHIEKLHREQKKQFSEAFTVYRGQGLPAEKFEKMKKSKGGLLSFNDFVSTSRVEHVSKDFVDRAMEDSTKTGILYTITVDPSISSAPFASVDDVSCYGAGEKEILFSMHTVFRLGDIKQDNLEPRLWHVQLTLTSDNDSQLDSLLERMRLEIGGSTPSYRLGALMIKLGDYQKAEELYKGLLLRTHNEVDKANLYFQLGYISDNQGYYDQALHYYDSALRIYTDCVAPDHPNIASCHNNIGLVYDNKKEYEKALSYYQTALKIYQKSSPSDNANVGTCYSSIGLVLNSQGKYQKALPVCQQAIEILEKTLPPTHPTLATAYNNIGLVHSNLKKYSDAVSSYKRAIDIGKQALPDTHPDLVQYRKNLETVRHK